MTDAQALREIIARAIAPRAWQRGYTSPGLKDQSRKQADAIIAALTTQGYSIQKEA